MASASVPPPRAELLTADTERDPEGALRIVAWLVVALSVVPVLMFWFFRAPVQMVVVGGVAQALMLPLIGIAATYLRHRRLPPDVQPSKATTVLLWFSTAVMAAFALYYVISRLV